ncbi:MAG TPA: inositol monophosphatase family protein [Candidatus Paceibacterota bacterium]
MKLNDSFEQCLSPEVAAAARVAVKVGGLVASGKWSSEMQTKSHPTFGTASYTEADIGGQLLAIADIHDQFDHARFLAEEESAEAGMNPNPFPGDFSGTLDFSLDMIDGTTPFRHALFNWCSAIGVGRNQSHFGGVIYAPEVRGGLTIAGEKGRGVYLWEHGSEMPVLVSIGKVRSKPVIVLGLDVMRGNAFEKFLSVLPKNLKPRGIAESGALGLALVAAGRLDAIVQSPQMPWDWCGGYSLVHEAGGAFQCFHVVEGRIVPLEAPTAGDYASDAQRLGFIAGHPDLVPELFSLLKANVG